MVTSWGVHIIEAIQLFEEPEPIRNLLLSPKKVGYLLLPIRRGPPKPVGTCGFQQQEGGCHFAMAARWGGKRYYLLVLLLVHYHNYFFLLPKLNPTANHLHQRTQMIIYIFSFASCNHRASCMWAILKVSCKYRWPTAACTEAVRSVCWRETPTAPGTDSSRNVLDSRLGRTREYLQD